MVVFLMNPVWSVYEIKTKAWVVQALGIGLYMKLDLDVVGDNAEILPLAFPDAEVGALEGKAAFKDAGIAVFLEREGGAYFFCIALDRQGAGHLIVAVAQRLYLAGFEAGQRMRRQVQPFIFLKLGVGFSVAGIDAGQGNFDGDFGRLGLGRIEAEFGGLHFAEMPVHAHIHLAIAKRDAAGLGVQRRVFDGAGVAEYTKA